MKNPNPTDLEFMLLAHSKAHIRAAKAMQPLVDDKPSLKAAALTLFASRHAMAGSYSDMAAKLAALRETP